MLSMKGLSKSYLFIAKLIFKLPRWLKNMIAKSIAVIVFDVFRFRRAIALNNISRVFPEWSNKKKRRIARQSIQTQGFQLIDFFSLPFLDKKWVEEHLVFDGWENHEKAQALGKGVLFLGLHLGNGELALGGMALKGLPLTLIGKNMRNKKINNILYSSRAATGLQFIPPHGKTTAMQILKGLKEGKSIIFILDQHIYPPYGVATTFFGHHVGTGFGLALFAMKTGAPVLPLHTFRDQNGKNHVVFGEPIPFTHAENREQTLKTMTQKYNHVLEETIQKYPGQWMWIHKRWKPFPVD